MNEDVEIIRSPRDPYISSKRKKYRKRRHGFIEPITSYGIIAYCRYKDKIYFLLYQRRDNFEYMDFIRGLWNGPEDLPSLFSAMSPEERQRIRNFTFEELWEDLWVQHESKIFTDGFSKAKKRYDLIKEQIPAILDSTVSFVKEPPWGFPKGKKNSFREASIVCALREFEEETRISTKSVNIDPFNASPYIETFKGSDDKVYSTHYYLAEFPEMATLPSRMETPHCIRDKTVSEEASNVKWVSYDEACKLLTDQRVEFLQEIMEHLSS